MAHFNARPAAVVLGACVAAVGCGGGDSASGELDASMRTEAIELAQLDAPDAEKARRARRAAEAALDAHHWPTTAPHSYFSNATSLLIPPNAMQPFRAEATGTLTRVTLNLCVTGTTGNTVIQIRRAAAFASPVIATAEVPRSGSPVWGSAQCPAPGDMAATTQAEVSFDLGAARIGVAAGEELSVTLVKTDTTAATDHWFRDFNGNRAATRDNWLVLSQVNGSQTDAFGYRMRFRTYVAPMGAAAGSGYLPPVAAPTAARRVTPGGAVSATR